MALREWASSNPPSECQICGSRITNHFYDAPVRGGPWAYMCPSCHRQQAASRGTNIQLLRDGKWYIVPEKDAKCPICGDAHHLAHCPDEGLYRDN